jgi:hypothetical protein
LVATVWHAAISANAAVAPTTFLSVDSCFIFGLL